MALILDSAIASAASGRMASCCTSSSLFFRSSPAPTSTLNFLRATPQLPLRRTSFAIVCASNPSAPTKKEGLDEQLEHSITDAQEICAGNDTSEECAVAWDEVEEISAAMAHRRIKAKIINDPLETFCKDNPETDECRVYED